MPRSDQNGVVHLYRGAPPVRSWSKYQTTVKDWALCGRRAHEAGRLTEKAGDVTCPHCLQLMKPTKAEKAQAKAKAKAGAEETK